ncbi:MAG: Holliday junction branch migration protein RuvA [bacterium]
MIGKLTGQFGGTTLEECVVVDVAGVGYVVRVPTATREWCVKAHKDPVLGLLSLYIHTAVREDAIDLYGFPTEAELSFFKQLMSVSGIGPKTALGIFDKADVSGLERAIRASDMATLTNAFGISKKLAERLVVELRDKIKATTPSHDALQAQGKNNDAEVIEALMALGYNAAESRAALKNIPPAEDMRERLGKALRNI